MYKLKRKGPRRAKVEHMKEYKQMTQKDINNIISKGGDDLRKLNKKVSEYLESLKLSQKAINIIADTDLNNIAECFGGLMTAEEVEQYIKDNYIDDVQNI